ncbi:MAG: hypothetical protein QUS09_10715, partial [Methanotrichaceae archaeon]|nr:hypothetical protein [Methanotrichaceae archaeon]
VELVGCGVERFEMMSRGARLFLGSSEGRVHESAGADEWRILRSPRGAEGTLVGREAHGNENSI